MQNQSTYTKQALPPISSSRAGTGVANQYTFPSPSSPAVDSIHCNELNIVALTRFLKLMVLVEAAVDGTTASKDPHDSTRHMNQFYHYPSPSPSLPPTRYSTPAFGNQAFHSNSGFTGFRSPSSLPPPALQSPSPLLSDPQQFFKPPPPISQPLPALYGSGPQQSYIRNRVSPERVVLRPLRSPSASPSITGTPLPLTWEEPRVCDNVDARSIRTPAPTPTSPISTPSPEENVGSLSSSLTRSLAPTVTQASDAALDALLEPLGAITPSTKPAASHVSHAPIPNVNQPASQTPIGPASTARTTSPSPAQVGTSSQNPGWSVAESDGQQTSAPKASMGTAEKELKRYTTDRKLAKAVADFVKNYDDAVVDLAKGLNVDPGRVRKLIGFHRRERVKKEPTPYQAGLFKKAQMVNGDREKGDRVKLKDMHQLLQDDKRMMAEVEKGLKSTKVQQWVEELKAVREEKFNGERGSEKAIAREATSTMDHVKLEMENMSRSTGAFTFGFMCRSEFGSSVAPAYWGLGPIEDFLWVKFKMTGFDFVSAAQAFACLEASGDGKDVKNGRSKKEKADALRKITTSIILKGLQEILGPTVKNVRMEYKFYDVNIVRVHGVKLVNWPADIPFNSPSNIKNDEQARTIYDLVRSATIRWEKLSKSARSKEVERIDRQIREGILHLPTRSTRSDKGGTHKKRSRDSDTNDGDEDDSPPPPAKRARKPTKNSTARKRKVAPTPAPKSSEFIDESESEPSATPPTTVTDLTPQQPSIPNNHSSPSETHLNPPSSNAQSDQHDEDAGLDALRVANPGLEDDELRELLADADAAAEEDDTGVFGGNDDVDEM
ncbi:hypothetical protein PQX77_000595 [Marasmius sp. AFHP31]|nr:hypothetical protein PQX77_000595 [Marasmius sp. AFHP31]